MADRKMLKQENGIGILRFKEIRGFKCPFEKAHIGIYPVC